MAVYQYSPSLDESAFCLKLEIVKMSSWFAEADEETITRKHDKRISLQGTFNFHDRRNTEMYLEKYMLSDVLS